MSPEPRMRLSCRAAENLMLSDEVLASQHTDWPSLRISVESWIAANDDHIFHAEMVRFRDSGFDRKNADLKTIRNVLLGLFSHKPWEVLVGQAIAQIARNGKVTTSEHGLSAYLGDKVCQNILDLK